VLVVGVVPTVIFPDNKASEYLSTVLLIAVASRPATKVADEAKEAAVNVIVVEAE
jgi:hypothetical protein